MKEVHRTIVIFGSGKAALLHLSAYLRLWDNQKGPKIHIIAGDTIDAELAKIVKGNSDHIHFQKPDDFTGFDRSTTLVDICTPTENHRDSIEYMFNEGFVNFLVEKPMVTTFEDLQWIASSKIKIAVMENYKFSKVTQRTIELIESMQMNPDFMGSFFCKNRTHESMQMRGFSNSHPPHVFTIELPHQLYLAALFLGPANVYEANSQNMRTKENIFSEHGSGSIFLDHDNIGYVNSTKPRSVHFSCLSSEKIIRRVVLLETNKRRMTLDYPINKDNLTSKIEIHDQGKLVLHEIFENDDMIKIALDYYYSLIFGDPFEFSDKANSLSISDTSLLIQSLIQNKKSDTIENNSVSSCMGCHEICAKLFGTKGNEQNVKGCTLNRHQY